MHSGAKWKSWYFVYSDVESEIKSTDDPEIRQRKEANVRTRATMASLKQKMEQAKLNKVGVSTNAVITCETKKRISVVCVDVRLK